MRKVYVRITRIGIHEEVLTFNDDTSDEQIFNEVRELPFDVEDDIEMENEIEYSIKEVSDR